MRAPLSPRTSERSLGVRLAVTAAAAMVVFIPFAVVAILVISAWWPLRTLDHRLADALHAYAVSHPGLVDAAEVWSTVFGPGPLRVAVLVVAVFLWWRGMRRTAIWAVITMVAGGVLGAVLKLIFGRDRPDLLDPVAQAPGYSFPSGHALNAALAASVLVLALLPLADRVRDEARRRLLRWSMWVLAAVLTGITGLCRIALGVHWMSDVLGGWVLGAALAAATTAAFATWLGRPATEPVGEKEGAEDGAADDAADGAGDGARYADTRRPHA
jgi:undecaprenyl-diphosphatase